MKALVKWGLGKDNMGLREVPEPKIGPHDILLEVGAVGICGSDLHIWKDEKPHKEPVILGHEFSGVIIGKGEKVSDRFKIGDRVIGDLETLDGRIGTDINGAFANYLSIPEALVHHLPDNLSFEEGSLIELVTCTSHALMYRTQIKPADFIVITGPGPVGLVMLQMTRLYNPRAIMVTGLKTDVARLKKAQELGADYIYYSEDDPVKEVFRLTEGVGADVVIDCSGGEVAITQATRMVRIGGWVTIMGLWGHEINVNLDKIPYNNLTIRGSWGWAGMESGDAAVRMAYGWHSWERALKIMAMGKVNLSPIITRRITLDQWKEAFELLEAKKEIKIIVYPNEKYMPK
ncbi:MAG: zinc-binding dehydrogenase [Candidatus Bathyarchaeia archaeon]